ncbi:MAG: hypothetical protein SFV23_06420 [Planctomycetaceae bacterium]|nr:hypothetical protein [Planctomycetaceae bacterium]
MTIQFHCPYCTAAIEVDDAAAGNSGKCPMCGARVTVPRPAGMPALPTTNRPPGGGEISNTPSAPVPAAPVVVDVTTPAAPLPSDPLQLVPPVAVSRKARRRGRRRSYWWFPLLGIGSLLGALAWMARPPGEGELLTGKLTGQSLTTADLPLAILSCDDSRLPSRQVEGLLEELGREGIDLKGDLMDVQIRGAKAGLTFAVLRGRRTDWYRVDVGSHRGLTSYLAGHREDLNATRLREATKARDDFFEARLRIEATQTGEIDLAEYRDRLALAALTRGLGYHVAARVENTLYRCVRETEDGLLYFLLPHGVKEFQLTGRKLPDGSTPFMGNFVVHVKPAPSAPDAPAESAPKTRRGSNAAIPADESVPAMSEPE